MYKLKNLNLIFGVPRKGFVFRWMLITWAKLVYLWFCHNRSLYLFDHENVINYKM
jgi:hypothetical protein